MIILQNNYECDYEMRLFGKLYFTQDDDPLITTNFTHTNDIINVYTTIIFEDTTYFYDHSLSFKNDCMNVKLVKKVYTAACCMSFCLCARQIHGLELAWGVMMGVRPAKNVRSLYEDGYSINEAKQILKDVYGTRDDKIELACTVAENERSLLDEITDNSVSLYIGIPFCPTRCLYCSFVSTDVHVSGKYMDEFVEKLLLEIEKTAEVMKKMGVYAQNIYIGGGTPTTLSAMHLKSIFDKLHECIDMSNIREFTLEAGRPDTITYEKMLIAKEGGVNRVSVNPQTMHDETLARVGRTHTADMIHDAYNIVRRVGFETVNMDLIAGLPRETVQMFCESLDSVIDMNPENITVHSMCIKRAADLRHTNINLAESDRMNSMLSYTQSSMNEIGMIPYYMYRQKNSSGNLENVGYSKIGHMSVYNINIMEETQTILAMGGGGSTKIVRHGKIQRIFNFKDPYEYIKRFDEILKRKDEILSIWE